MTQPHPPRAARTAARHHACATRILAAARGLLASSGPSALTMRAVARDAGYSAGSVYGYFTSKEDLLAAIAVEELEALAAALKHAPTARPHLCAEALHRIAPVLLATRRGDVPDRRERALTGRLIAVLRLLDAAMARDADDASGSRAGAQRGEALDTVGLWCGLVGVAVLADSGRLASLGLTGEEVTAALAARFGI